MKRAVLLALAVALLVACVAYAYAMNPGDVEIRLTRTLSYRMPLGILFVASLAIGAVAGVIAIAVQQLSHRLATWGERRKAREVALIDELNASGVALAWGGDIERSRSVLTKAWRRDPHNKTAAIGLAASYADTGEFESARATLATAVEQAPTDPDLRFALAEALRRNGDIDEAIRLHESIRVQYPHAARVLVALRELYAHAERWKEAVDVQERYIGELANAHGMSRERLRLREYRYRAALQIDDAAKRLTALLALLDEDRDYAPAIDGAGDALVAMGRAGEALKIWEKAFRRDPRSDLARRMLAQQKDNQGRRHLVALIDKFADRLPADDVHLLRASAALDSEALEAAQRELELVTDATNASVQQCWADLHQKRGDPERAWQTLRPIAG